MTHRIDHPGLEGELLLITPSLEVVALVSSENFARVYPRLRKLFSEGDGFAMARIRDVALVHDNESLVRDAETVDLHRLSTLLMAYESAAMRPVRQRATHFELSNFGCNGGAAAERRAPGHAVAMSLANNFFPDDWAALAVRIDIADESAWAKLTELRTELVNLFGQAFWWSTLGFRFRLNQARLDAAGPEQSALGMRLLGVDWDDCLGQFTALSAYGLRSINWQTLVSAAALNQWTLNKSIRLAPSAVTVQGHRLWQAGASPSLGDRNAGLTSELKEYVRMGKGLSSLCQHFDTAWFGEEVFERWSSRWNELALI